MIHGKGFERPQYRKGSMIHFGIFGPAQEIVNGDIKIIGQSNERFIIGLPRLGLIPADAVLIHIQFDSQSNLRYVFFLPQLFESKNALSPLDKIIPKWYNPDIPFWYYSAK